MTRILIGGMAVLDFVHEIAKLPDKPEKYTSESAVVVLGGCAANAAIAVARLGGNAILAARIGDDEIGRLILSLLNTENVDCSLLQPTINGNSSHSSILVDHTGERQIVNYRGDQLEFDTNRLTSSNQKFNAVLADTRWEQGAIAAMRVAKELNVPGIIDAEAPVSENAIRLASHVAFSKQGLFDYTKQTSIETALMQVHDDLDAWVCVTDGSKGTYLVVEDKLLRIPGFHVDAVDTLGAGDVWHGAFALRLGSDYNEMESVSFANAVGAYKCTKRGGGNGAPNSAELEEFILMYQTPDS